MSDVVVGPDGKARCAWAGADDSLVRYHDKVWGKRIYDESALFEALTLGVFQAGLSWEIVFHKRDAFQKAFHGFDVAKVARMTSRDVGQLVEDASIIRNRAKIEATVNNARAMLRVNESGIFLDRLAVVQGTKQGRVRCNCVTSVRDRSIGWMRWMRGR